MVAAPILHCDLDAFYASVEQFLDPSLRGKPVLVGGGVVVAASYEARAHGVSAPMNVRAALARCPGAIVVPGSFKEYADFSERVMAVLSDFSPIIEQISIDEAFVDVSGTTHLLGSPAEIGRAIRSRVREEIGIPISVGIASSKFLAKVASAQAKPDGLLFVDPADEIDWLHGLPVRVIWGVGPVTEGRLGELGVGTVGELAHTPVETLTTMARHEQREPSPSACLEPGPTVGRDHSTREVDRCAVGARSRFDGPRRARCGPPASGGQSLEPDAEEVEGGAHVHPASPIR